MRDSALKRLLVSGYFSGVELAGAIRGAWTRPPFPTADLDYDDYWRTRGVAGYQPRHEMIASVIAPADSVLDVGCGTGPFLTYLHATRGVRGIGIDVSPVAVARVRAAGFEAFEGTLDAFRRAQPAAVFDHVVVSEVIEHVADAEALLRNAWDLTRGSLWITFPNIAYLPHRIRLLSGRFPVQWVVHPAEHVRFWSLPDFRDWLHAQGMTPAAFRASSGIAVFGLHRLWPNLLANQVVVHLRRGHAA
jgi:methionine biosynthesis protein MetW